MFEADPTPTLTQESQDAPAALETGPDLEEGPAVEEGPALEAGSALDASPAGVTEDDPTLDPLAPSDNDAGSDWVPPWPPPGGDQPTTPPGRRAVATLAIV